jgi:ActR/RegA family two-component response regulator
LIVEDEVLIAFHLQCLVEEAGHRVTAIARDPDEALAAAALECPDFAMVDLRLAAGTSGIEAARLLYET